MKKYEVVLVLSRKEPLPYPIAETHPLIVQATSPEEARQTAIATFNAEAAPRWVVQPRDAPTPLVDEILVVCGARIEEF